MNIRSERLSAGEYTAFLKETDLGKQYPKERFSERIERLVQNADISLTARSDSGRLLGVCFGITDFAYWLFITDLGVVRDAIGQGIGRTLMRAAHELAGGEKDIAVYTCANSDAIGFYKKLGMTESHDIMEYNRIEWTGFTVGEN